MNVPEDPSASPRGRGKAERFLARVGEPLVATWTVAGALIALIYSVGALHEAVHEVPWLMGPILWILTALGSAAILRGLPGHDYPSWGLLTAVVAGGVGDGLVVIAGHPWPGLVVGVVVFSIAMALLRRTPRLEATSDEGRGLREPTGRDFAGWH